MTIQIEFPEDSIDAILEMVRKDDLICWPNSRQRVEEEMEYRIRKHGDGNGWFEYEITRHVKKELIQRCYALADKIKQARRPKHAKE